MPRRSVHWPGLLSREALELSAEAQVLGCVARFDQVKGLEILVESLRRLAGRYPRLVLVLVGSGRGERRLQEQVRKAGLADRVRFTGELADATRLFSAFDLYVSASRGEGLPLALLEAMACELPVVATRVTGHVDVVVDGVTGFLTRPGDSEDLARALGRLLDDPELRQRMGRAGREPGAGSLQPGAHGRPPGQALPPGRRPGFITRG